MSESDGESTSSRANAYSDFTRAPLFEIVKPPRLDKSTKEAVTKFQLEYEKYLEIFANNEALIGKIIPPTPMKSCFDRQLLKNLAPFEFDNTYPSDITEEQLEAWIKTRIDAPQKSILSAVESQVKKSLRMQVNIKDADSRILELFIQHNEIMEKCGWTDNFDRHSKVAVNQVIAVLKPEGFKLRVEQDLEDDQRDLYNNNFKFCKYLRAEALRCERYHPLEPKLKSVSFDSQEPSSSDSRRTPSK
jgi:hypothetical protein